MCGLVCRRGIGARRGVSGGGACWIRSGGGLGGGAWIAVGERDRRGGGFYLLTFWGRGRGARYGVGVGVEDLTFLVRCADAEVVIAPSHCGVVCSATFLPL
jgi:hypothetical protein